MFDNSSTSYILCKRRLDRFANCVDVGIDNIKLQYNNAHVVRKKQSGKSLVLVGRFVDGEDYNRDEEQIADELLNSNGLDDLLEKSKSLSGRFVIIYTSGKQLLILPDATASIPVNYSVIGDLCVSSNPKIIADINGWQESNVSKKITSSGDPTQPLPYDMTMYDQIKMVPPNHFFECEARTVIRHYPLEKRDPVTVDMAATIASKLLMNIITGYHKQFRLSLPLTSGLDSRTILAMCRDIMDDVPTYTFFHHNFSENTADVVIPRRIAEQHGFKHFVLRHSEIPVEILEQYREALGSAVNPNELQNAWTYSNSQLADRTRLCGTVSPLGKSNFGRDLPESLATPPYLVTKTHHYTRENKSEVKRWVQDIQAYSQQSKVSKFDLFYWEHREGNRTANSLMNSDLLIESLEPFNCRELIETLLRVPRRERMDGQIHKKVIGLNWPELMEFPLNPDEKHALFYSNSLLYYVGVKGKYLLERFQRRP
jgi:asparagine synthetase B (glutamine-hydrolysing)